jgi:hypothetical protein
MKQRTWETDHDKEAEFLPSASGFDADFRCLGRRALCKQLPRYEDDAVQRRGKKIHDALAESDLEQLSDTDAKTASRSMYAEAKLVNEFDFEGAHVFYEQRVWDFDELFQHTWSARVDTFHLRPRRLLVADYKSGWGIPPPIHINWQIRSEASLLAELYDAEEVVCAIIHPHHPDSLYEAQAYTRQDLDDLLATVRHNVKAIQLPDQPRTPGGIQCQFCQAKRVCPEYKAYQAEVEQSIADEIEDEGFTAILRQTPQQRGEQVRRIKEFVKNCALLLKQYTEMAVENGEAVSGYTLRRKMLRSFIDEARAMELVRDNFGADVLYDATHLSLTDLEKELAKKGTMREAKDSVLRVLKPVLRFKTSEYYLEESRSL